MVGVDTMRAPLIWGLAALLGAATFSLAWIAYAVWYFRWEDQQTQGMAYYGRSSAERRRLKARIRAYSAPVVVLVRLAAALGRGTRSMPAFGYQGIAGPPKVSSPAVFGRAQAYEPRPEDVFVVTQMRCGTTWMQQIVYEVVNRGQGNLGDSGNGSLYAMSPWIDGTNSVSLEDAPLVGAPPTRIIKSHLPASLCPYNERARYVYVTRHPVSCFASIVDYQRTLLGPLAPPVEVLAAWFCSERMYWSPWPAHVDGWWRLAQKRVNVLFIHFEEIKADPAAAVDRVAMFLERPLTVDERQQVLDRCSFEYMRAHQELFEMSPPTMFSIGEGRFFASGAASRHTDVSPAVREQITTFCRGALRGSPYPVTRFYPDLAIPSEDAPGVQVARAVSCQ